jgi:GAF domain-containing protein
VISRRSNVRRRTWLNRAKRLDPRHQVEPCRTLSLSRGVVITIESDPFDESNGGWFRTLEVLARGLNVGDAELQPTLDAIVRGAVDALPSADYAGVILMLRGRLSPQSAAGRPPQQLDVLQQRIGLGPCIDAANEQVTLRIDDTEVEPRWRRFCTEAAALGVRSLVCVPLWVDDHRLGTLSVYSEASAAFRKGDETIARVFATLAALALDAAQRTDALRQALRNRDLIGQAKGILMERRRMSADAAFEFLSQASQAQNVKLLTLAERLAATGEIP